MVALPDGVLEVLQSLPFDSPGAVGKLERAANDLYALLNVKFEDGIQEIKAISDRLKYYSEQHDAFSKRLVEFFKKNFADMANSAASKDSPYGSATLKAFVGSSTTGALMLPKHEDILTFLSAFKSLIVLCRTQSPRDHFDLCTAYQSSIGGQVIQRDLARFFDAMKTNHLLRRPNSELSSIFINPNTKGSGIGPFGSTKASIPASTKSFSVLQVLKAEDAPFVKDNEFLYPGQALQCVILLVALNIAQQYRLIATNLFGQPDSPSLNFDVKISKKLE